MTVTPASSAALLELARVHIRAAVLEQAPGQVADDEVLSLQRGCFISLHEHRGKRLRGCIGRLAPDKSLGVIVPQLARSVLRDPRFEHHRVTPADLGDLEVEITLLSAPTRATGPLDFDLEREGIVLEIEDRSGCFLPRVAQETGWAREQLLQRLCTEKLGLPQDAWKQPNATLQKFTAQIIGPARV